MILNVQAVNHYFGDRQVLYDVNLQVAKGQFVALVGPSGCGKTTLLKAVLGTHPPTHGHVMANGHEVIGPSRDVGIVYQAYSLAPNLTAVKAVAEGPKLDQTNLIQRSLLAPWWWKLRRQHLEQAKALLEKVDLGHALHSYPHNLSGGMRQRVAICQALIMKPKILLLDEPFGALDEATREDLQDMLLHLYQENVDAKKQGKEPPHTLIFVTHELNEAFLLADRVVGFGKMWKCPQTGHSGATHGATIMFDKAAPIFRPGEPRDYAHFHDDKALLRRIVFNEEGEMYDRQDHCTFWSDLGEGVGTGVSLMPREAER